MKSSNLILLVFHLLFATTVNSQTAQEYYSRGLSKFFYNKDYSGAISDFTKVIEINPKIAMAYCNRGNSKLQIKEYNAALVDYTKAIEIDNKFTDAYFNRGLLKILLTQKNSGCLDLSKAGELGQSKAYEYIKQYCQ